MNRQRRESHAAHLGWATAGSVSIGDVVCWRGAWGEVAAKVVQVLGLEITDHPREKYGREVDSATWSMVRANRVLFTLDNGHWAYGSQIHRASESGRLDS